MNDKLSAFYFSEPFSENYWAEILTEIYTDRVYAPYIEGKNLKTCLEIGANVGLAAYYFSKHFDKVYSLEPALEHYTALTAMLEYNKITNVEPFKLALSTRDGEALFFHRVLNKTMYSLRPEMPTNDTEQVKTIQIGTFLRENNIDHVDVLKLDCEGSEADIVCHTSFQENADKIDMVFCEIHTWIGRNRSQLIDGFKMAGFTKITKIPNKADLIICQR